LHQAYTRNRRAQLRRLKRPLTTASKSRITLKPFNIAASKSDSNCIRPVLIIEVNPQYGVGGNRGTFGIVFEKIGWGTEPSGLIASRARCDETSKCPCMTNSRN